MDRDTLKTASGGAFWEEPGDRGPMTFLEFLDAHIAVKRAAAGMLERPRGVGRGAWAAACEIADDVMPGFCWVLGHLGGPGGRLLDMLVRTSGTALGGLPDPGPESWPLIYHALHVPPGACPHCGIFHDPRMPHELGSRYYQGRFFAHYARRPTLADAMAHCSEPVQTAFVAMWSAVGAWPTIPPGWQPPADFGARVRAAAATAMRAVK